MMRVSDCIIETLEVAGIDTCFCVTGGAAAHLMDSLAQSKKIKTIHMGTEQSCAMAADAYARIAKKPALVLVTNGPGATNAITGVMGAWQDSIPMIVLSGQISSNHMLNTESRIGSMPMRQLGLQEVDIIALAKNFTKLATTVHNYVNPIYEYALRDFINMFYQRATSDRMGPVWIEVPIDVQSTTVVPHGNKPPLAYEYSLWEFLVTHENHPKKIIGSTRASKIYQHIAKASRPIVIAGNGIHLSNTEKEFLDFVRALNLPVVCTWSATDLFSYDDPQYVGNFGILGERVANKAVQDADLLLILGSRLSIPNIGYNTSDFSPDSFKIMVDLDHREIEKKTLKIDSFYLNGLQEFFTEMAEEHSAKSHEQNPMVQEWIEKLQDQKYRYSVFFEDHSRSPLSVNSFDLIEVLPKLIPENSILVTDMGTAFTCTMQAFRNSGKGRLLTSSALCAMGFGLPGAIGAWMATGGTSPVYCIAGDGGLQMNMQEFQTIRQYNIPIRIIVLNNHGYLAVSLMQDNLFGGRRFGSDEATGLGSPCFLDIAVAYKIPAYRALSIAEFSEVMRECDSIKTLPCLIEVEMKKDQLLIPRVQSMKDDSGKIVSGKLDRMFPPMDII